MSTSPQTRSFDLASVPPIYILPSHLTPEALHEHEDLVFRLGGSLTYDSQEARVFLGNIGQKRRASFDLRARGVWTEEAPLPETDRQSTTHGSSDEGPPRKKPKAGWIERDVKRQAAKRRPSSRSSTESSTQSDDVPPPPDVSWPNLKSHIVVLKLAWLESCIKQGHIVHYRPFIVYTGRIIPKPAGEASPKALRDPTTYVKTTPGSASGSSSSHHVPKPTTSILERARADAAMHHTSSNNTFHPHRRRFGDHAHSTPSLAKPPPKLHRTTTSEFEDLANNPLPPLPDWATGPYAHYSCCRDTPMLTRNAAFIAQLTKIKESRILTLDDIGVRAYSTSIASLSAYEHHIRHPEEIIRLPGCNAKLASLWSEWYHSAETDGERSIATVRALDEDVDLQHLRLFWNIWGVGPDTARKFYFERGWKDLDDVVEFGWAGLTRVQQIGVKYYDEFMAKIPRAEVEQISGVILDHARSVLGVKPAQYGGVEDVECIIVGGYRRGKTECGDVDVVLSHRDEAKTKDLVVDIVSSLEATGWITHTLSLHTTTSDRGQATLPFRANHHGGGFDSLDKALCVWQDPRYDDGDADDEEEGQQEKLPDRNEKDENDDQSGNAVAIKSGKVAKQNKNNKKNPNIHRRVDIIISSWRTVGCAVLGWSGGTTFQRDIRQFVSKTRGLKFDSSGVRDRANGLVLDLEAPRPKTKEALEAALKGKQQQPPQPPPPSQQQQQQQQQQQPPPPPPVANADVEWDDKDTWQDRERRLMDGLGFGYRPPEKRCTG
ncbi:hypothetical protein PV08_05708 [Exophiala spinifera]|uniref:BRCT domain-containing protein n=1 Tax=Exophiala spinifera TaxID=91928 RepID=A0A0D2BWK2_9EURO|nr:uncharacterized protein PV08_05708 [Exophiala spinifera]KIW15659.1 hypothetical protein PV08_05708 [Exophiala spinifera]